MLTQNETYVILYYKEAFELVYSEFQDKLSMTNWLVNFQLENQDALDVRIVSVTKGELQFAGIEEEEPHGY